MTFAAGGLGASAGMADGALQQGNIAATCRLVVPWMRVSAQRVSQWSRSL
jgi:hypothetical protein